jgi:DNA topoisomerase I
MNVLIVESAAKGRTLQRYLGDGWKVLATGGHVETLPDDRKRHGKDATKAFWANRPGELPSPPWVWTDRGESAVQAILDEAGPDPEFWIATDPDREGEFIAWCLDRLLASHGATHRVSFQEVTDTAVRAALDHPRPVDARMVESALVRKFLDRLVGFRTSKMASSIVGAGASMGRVQTPTLGFVVERELEREAHVPIPYFEVRALAEGVDLKVRFHERSEPDAWKDEAGRVDTARTFERSLAEGAEKALRAAGRVTVTSVAERSRERKPDPPFSTDALLQAAGSRFGWSPGKTSALASMLYEAGHITYIRTDSTRIAQSALESARTVVRETFGDDHLGPGASGNAPKGPVQDAHEAIRPTRMEVDQAPVDDDDARRLYRLVRAHTLASQMAPSRRTILSIEAACDALSRPLTGSVSWRTFAGWEAAYDEFLTRPATSPPAIALEVGAVWTLDPATDERDNPLLVEDQTRPPPRYRPHTLIKAMKDAGIGRPSTYARTVEKLDERSYVVLEEGALAPTERGRNVWTQAAPLYAREADAEHTAAELFSPEFTALMEERLDRIAEGELNAPETWEGWRDRIRDLHEVAQEAKKSGASTPKQHKMLLQLYVNAPDGWPKLTEDEINALSWTEAQARISELKQAGVRPAPTEKQRAYLERLVADLELGADELEEAIGVRDLDALADTVQASAAIDTLQRLFDERRPPSTKQRRFVADLVKDAGLSDAEAAALVGVSSLDELTGGREGSASALIDLLQQRLEAPAGA